MACECDFNGAELHGFDFYQVTQKGGQRWSVAAAFLRPALQRLIAHTTMSQIWCAHGLAALPATSERAVAIAVAAAY